MSVLKTNPRRWRQLRTLVLRRDHYACYYCGGRATEADHFISRKNNGTDSIENLVAACRDCNEDKGAMDGAAFFTVRGLQNAGDRKNSLETAPFKPLTGDFTDEVDP
jgi:5-methylcytosine-specific restriction endonuclease McrA